MAILAWQGKEPWDVAEVLQYTTTTSRSPTPGVRLITFLGTDGVKHITRLDNPLLTILVR
jgi:hypothetical protein